MSDAFLIENSVYLLGHQMVPAVDLFLGIDFGTSGARAITIDASGCTQAQSRCEYPPLSEQNVANDWQSTLWTLLDRLPRERRQQVQAIAIDGTSSTTLLCDTHGQPVLAPLMYNDARARRLLPLLERYAPDQHITLNATSGLVKLCWLLEQMLAQDCAAQGAYGLSQADWLGFLLHGQLGMSDYHNCLKLGYDVDTLQWPDWVRSLEIQGCSLGDYLPTVLAPGTAVGTIRPDIAECYGFPRHCQVKAGTTDSIAAFLASGSKECGQAVTSLGSSLAIKLLSRHRVEDRDRGIYSHRLADRWLVGGASNTGGAVLKRYFTDEELQVLSDRIDPAIASPLQYYPLFEPGERFPINDPEFAPKLTPRPVDDAEFLHGLLEGMARIEAQGYRLLQTLGAPVVTKVLTAGGGAKNQTWTAIRARNLGGPVAVSPQTEAAYGSAMLARDGLIRDGLN
ncbi:MAG: FGGY-family carbohydrate kinase [Synechococcus sp.]